MTLVSVQNLSVAFPGDNGPVHAVRNVSFDLKPGEILGIVGESGSGKSVTCRALLGLLPKRAILGGQILYDGKDLAQPQALQQVRGREISMIFQNPASHLDPLTTIGDHVAEPLRFHFGLTAAEARREALGLLEAVHIRDAEARMKAYPHQLSGGMKQRVLIASALACRPRLLLADEPTTALDVTVQAGILELLREVNRKHGLTLALVSHDLGVIAEICDRVIVMRNGAIVEEGPIREVARNPQHDYTRLLIGSQPGRLPQMAEPREAPVGLLELRDLQVHFPTRSGLGGKAAQPIRAVDGISLAVREGECFGIVGESGSGKSTVARAIIGLNKGTGGEIRFDGKSVSGLAGEALTRFRRAEQMVFQSPFDSLNPRMTVQRTIAEPIWRHGLAPRSVAMAKALELMDMVELPRSFAARRPGQLSGGQCQRVGIARALALSPRVLIADEVTSALDVTIQAQILRLLTRLRKERNLTILYISHDLTVVKKFCDRVAVFRHGKLVESGATADLFATPQTDYTRELIAAAPDLDAAIAKGA